ncbi:MAG: hypothetical protein WC750_00700 [Patescibacteria group bacterium]
MPKTTSDEVKLQAKKSLPTWAIVLIFIAGLAIGFGIFWLIWSARNSKVVQNPNLPTPVANSNQPPSDVALPTATSSSENTISSDRNYLSEKQTFVQNPDNTQSVLDMEWVKPQFWGIKKALGSVVKAYKDKVSQGDYDKLVQWLDDQDTDEPYPMGERAVGTWLIGKVKSGKYVGSSLFIRHVIDQTTGDNYYRFLVSSDGKQVRLLDSLYVEPGIGESFDISTPQERLIFIEAYGLSTPKAIKVGQGTLTTASGRPLDTAEPSFFVGSDPGGLYTEWLRRGEIFSMSTIGMTKDNRNIYGNEDGQTYVQDDDGSFVRVAAVIPYKTSSNGDEQLMITWDTKALGGKTLAKAYSRPKGGCGETFWPKPPAEGEDLRSENLIVIGKTSQNDPVYMVKDMLSSPTVRLAYDGWYVPEPDKKSSFEDFVKNKPVSVIFWRDEFDRWTYYLDSEFMPMAECGKPVIYLYPTKTTLVSVSLPRFINVTVSEPTYPARGWQTVAQPDGTLTMADGQQFGSLYWEGTGVGYVPPREGFVVKDGEQKTFLTQTLAKYGLNAKESQEFMDFWLPRMTGAPYYRVSFLTSDWSKAAPLNVTPKPDTSIRIFMDWQKLSASISIAQPKIITPVRNGFTLVEWGGLLYK